MEISQSDFGGIDPQVANAGRSLIKDILSRSSTDAEFRAQLLDSPQDVLGEYSSHFKNVDIRFIENEADLTVVLPNPVDTETVLSEEELEAVAGGATTSPVCSVIATVAATLWLYDEVVEQD